MMCWRKPSFRNIFTRNEVLSCCMMPCLWLFCSLCLSYSYCVRQLNKTREALNKAHEVLNKVQELLMVYAEFWGKVRVYLRGK